MVVYVHVFCRSVYDCLMLVIWWSQDGKDSCSNGNSLKDNKVIGSALRSMSYQF